MKKSRISIIIPTYNRPVLLKRALNSIFRAIAPSGFEKEIIVVDNGDSDETFITMQRFLSEHRTELFYYKISQKGPSAARNFGLQKSKGDYIMFIDDDDEINYSLFKTLDEISVSPDRPLIILLGFCFIYHLGRIILNRRKPSRSFLPVWQRPIAVGSVFTRNVFVKHRICFDEKLVHLEDLDLSIRCDIKGIRIISINEPLYSCHVEMPWRKNSLTKGDFERLLQDTQYFCRKHYQYYASHGPKALAFLNYLKGMAYAKLGQFQKARVYFSRAKQLSPEIKYRSSYFLTYLGSRGFTAGRYLYFLLKMLT